MKTQTYINTVDELIKIIRGLAKKPVTLIAIDGRPGSGKTTLVDQLSELVQSQTIYLDEFFIPRTQWPANQVPRFPFFYFRYDEFIEGIKRLAAGQQFMYFPFDAQTNTVSSHTKTVRSEGLIFIEGVSVLNTQLISLYDLSIWVDSDQASELEALKAREQDKGMRLWRDAFLPSIELFCKQEPWRRADIRYAGRGILRNGTCLYR